MKGVNPNIAAQEYWTKYAPAGIMKRKLNISKLSFDKNANCRWVTKFEKLKLSPKQTGQIWSWIILIGEYSLIKQKTATKIKQGVKD